MEGDRMTYDDRMSDYIEVKDRVQAFYAKYPDGSLQSEYEIVTIGEKVWIVVKAYAYRTPEDPRPGIGHAWEAYPGTTSFTRTSELMVGETSAFGRATAALGIAVSRSIASKNEVRAAEARKTERTKEPTPEDDPFYTTPPVPRAEHHGPMVTEGPAARHYAGKTITEKQVRLVVARLKSKGLEDDVIMQTVNAVLSLGNMGPRERLAHMTNPELDFLLNNLDKVGTIDTLLEAMGK